MDAVARMQSQFFSQAEIEELTGLVMPSAQERLLKKQGLRVFRNASNRVMLSREAYMLWQSGQGTPATKPEPKLRPIYATP